MPKLRTTMTTKPYSVHLPEHHLATLQAEADRIDRPVAYLIRQAVADLVHRLEAETPPAPAHSRPS